MVKIISHSKLKIGDIFRFDQKEEPFRHCVVSGETENNEFVCERPYFYKTKIDGQSQIIIGVEKFHIEKTERDFVVLVSSLEFIEQKSEGMTLKIVAEMP